MLQQGYFAPSSLHCADYLVFFAQGPKATSNYPHDHAELARVFHNTNALGKNRAGALLHLAAFGSGAKFTHAQGRPRHGQT